MASITARAKSLNAWRRRCLARGAQLEFQAPLTLTAPVLQPWDYPTLNPDAIARPPLAIRPGKAVKLGRGSQLEFGRPVPVSAVAPVNNQDGAGAASGDATVDGALNALGDFAGAASGDAIASGALNALGDFAGSAIGDAIASGSLNAFSDAVGAATGDATASGVITARYDFPLSATCHLLTSQGARRKQRLVNLEVQRPTPITAVTPAVNSDGVGNASGDANADGVLSALGDFAGAASGDSIASGALNALADFAGSAIGDATASGVLNALADSAGSAIGDSTASGALNALADFVGDAVGDAIADAVGAEDNHQDCAGSAVGDSTCEGFIEDATPAVAPEAPIAQQSFPGAWGKPVRKPKRKKRLDELDEMIAELRSRIVEAPEVVPDFERTLRVSQALANNSDNASLQQIGNQIVLLRAAINEIDDEEVIMLLAA
jgi:hypothetical protein